MDARTKRALYHFLAWFLGTGILTTAYQVLVTPPIDWKGLGASVVAALAVAAVHWMMESDPTVSAPTTEATSLALQVVGNNTNLSVPPPTVRVPPATTLTTPPDPIVPPPTV